MNFTNGTLVRFCWCAILSVTALAVRPMQSSVASAEEPWVSLFSGRDLAGWVPLDVAPGTFSVRDGIIVSTGFPTGLLRTEKQYENFIKELD